MKKILSKNELSNKDLRDRNDLSPLLKTYVHRINNDSEKDTLIWWNLLDNKEKQEIETYYGSSSLRELHFLLETK